MFTSSGLSINEALHIKHCAHNVGLTIAMLKYFCVNHGDRRTFFQFENSTNVLVSSFRFIWILVPMLSWLWVHGHCKYLAFSVRGST